MTDGDGQIGKAKIEGGVDAIVIGGAPDGLVAAAYLARAGLKTVLFEASGEIGAPCRSAAPEGDSASLDGEHLFHGLDPQTIDDLDLYSCGVAFAARRMGVAYFFEDGECLRLGGDLRAAAQDADPDGDAFQHFITDAFEAASFMRPLFSGAPGVNAAFATALADAPPRLAKQLDRWMTQPAEEALADYFPEGAVKTAMLAEAAFRNGLPPHEAMSFSPLLARWSGEVAGLQGAVAFAEGGAGAVIDALRRAAQKAKVEFRTASPIARILIEKDRAAGVELDTGNQLRAPIVIAAVDAETTYTELIGPAVLDRAFQQSISMRKPALSTAHLHLRLKGAPIDETTRAGLARRIVYAPPADKICRAFAGAAQGDVPKELIIEAVFENAFDENAAPDRQQLSVLAHPTPALAASDEKGREKLRDAIVAGVERFAPNIAERIDAERLATAADMASASGAPAGAFAAREGVYRQLARAAATTSAGSVGGLFFCGPEAQIGYGINGAAGRNAAQAALGKIDRAGAAR